MLKDDVSRDDSASFFRQEALNPLGHLDRVILRHWDSLSKGINRIGASCLKKEAEPTPETLCLVSIFLSHDGQSPNEDHICMSYSIVKTV